MLWTRKKSNTNWLNIIFSALFSVALLMFSAPAFNATLTEKQVKTFNLEQRVSCQTVIEEIRWSHRLWPGGDSTSKPAFSEILSDAQMHTKVVDQLRMEAVLQQDYGIKISSKILQAEINRMAVNSKSPKRLQELFDALGNDPVAIAECLARPLLVRNKLYNSYTQDNRQHSELRAKAEAALAQYNGDLSLLEKAGATQHQQRFEREVEGAEQSSEKDLQSIALDNDAFEQKVIRLTSYANNLRETKTAFIYTQIVSQADESMETKQLVWQKQGFDSWWQERAVDVEQTIQQTETKALTLPVITDTGEWTAKAQIGEDSWSKHGDAPLGRVRYSSIWSGTEMIIWGGQGLSRVNTGGRYNPVTDSWLATTTIGAPRARDAHTAIWSGTEMIVWGGGNGSNTGGRYNPVTDSWLATATTTTGAPSTRTGHTAIWSDTEMIIWGGWIGDYANTGGRYNPVTDSWVATATIGAPSGRSRHTAIWSDTEMIVWGGVSDDLSPLNTGGRYNPVEDSWEVITTTGAPSGRRWHTAIWSDAEMIVWGGYDDSSRINTGGRYNPVEDTWEETTTIGAPDKRSDHVAIWSGTEMVVWGGYGVSFGINTGGRYNPLMDSWEETTTIGAPSGGSSAIWTGSEMIVWGGSYSWVGRGYRYNPALDSWRAATLTATDAPSGRNNHTAIWSGTEMIVWGGIADDYYANDGGRYDPATDSWIATTTHKAPNGRYGHTAVWSGTEMIIWGGYDNSSSFNTGGRYNPTTGIWSSINTEGAPSARFYHTAVWNHDKNVPEMIVWGGWGGGSDYLNTGGRYDSLNNSWTETSTIGAPAGRYFHTAIWTGSEMIVWGGLGSSYTNTGGIYRPSFGTWEEITTDGAPDARNNHTAVWSGSEMIIWGGSNGLFLGTGGRYSPSNKSWVTIPTSGAPRERTKHTAIWSGSEMIVWGGRGGDSGISYFGDGSRYNPLNDHWTVTSWIGRPRGRSSHTAIWTDSEMIVWGGFDGSRLNTGANYRPYPASETCISDSQTLGPVTYVDGDTITRQVEGRIDTNGEVVLLSGASVVFEAGISIELNKGFRADPGSVFSATIKAISCP